MNCKPLFAVLAAGALAWVVFAADTAPDKTHKLKSVSVRKMADSLHAVIAADRQAYAELIAQKVPTDDLGRLASEASSLGSGWPVHAILLRQAARDIQSKGAEFSYTLRSLWPINPAFSPQTEAEQAGLEAVARDPSQPFYTEEELGGRSYFTAIYADRATLPSCADCHNRHPRSPKQDFKQGEVMGAVVVRVPLEF